MDFLTITNENEEGFKAIADKLFHEYVIQTDIAKYRLIELEFYWNSKTHSDKSTYDRKHANPNTGEWFFHYSGVDIALKDDIKGGHGGILIRSIYDLETRTMTKGPMVCMMKLFSGYSAFESSITTKLVPCQSPPASIHRRPRKNLGNNAVESSTHKLNYAFYIQP